MKANLTRQKGFSLFIVMIIMLVIALLVIVTSQSASTETRISTNDADRKYALSVAESGLRDSETLIQSFADGKPGETVFSYDCDGGLCLPLEPVNLGSDPTRSFFGTNGRVPSRGEEVAWKRQFNNKIIWDKSNNTKTREGSNRNVRYIIEYLGQDESGSRFNFRVTARALGQNPNTVVMLQSNVELSR